MKPTVRSVLIGCTAGIVTAASILYVQSSPKIPTVEQYRIFLLSRAAKSCTLTETDLTNRIANMSQDLIKGGVQIEFNDDAIIADALGEIKVANKNSIGCQVLIPMYARVRITQNLSHAESIAVVASGIKSFPSIVSH
jgi:hypothetical protein